MFPAKKKNINLKSMVGGWKITAVHQTPLRIDIYLQLNVALLNSSSNTGIDMSKLGLALARSLKLCYEISYFQRFYIAPEHRASHLDNFSYLNQQPVPVYKTVMIHLDVRYRIIKQKVGLNKEHLVEVKDDKDLPGLYAEANKIYGSEIYVNADKISNILSGYDRNTLPHEFGHSLGLLHPDVNTSWFSFFGAESDQYWAPARQAKDRFNTMYSGNSKYMDDSLSTHIEPEQINRILQNIREKAVNQ